MRTPVLDVFRPLVRTASRVYFDLELRGTEMIVQAPRQLPSILSATT